MLEKRAIRSHSRLPRCLQPWTLNGLALPNRVIRAAAFAGATLEEMTKTHVELAEGGVGMTTVAYACVSSDGRTFKNQLDLSKMETGECDVVDDVRSRVTLTPLFFPRTAVALRSLTDSVHDAGAKVSVQLTHAGGFASTEVIGKRQKAPSASFSPANLNWSEEMSEDDLNRIAGDFAHAAAIAVTVSGFDAVELHCGHGYLLSQFLSPSTNASRGDGYGGKRVEDRMRFPLRVLRAVRAAVGSGVPVLVKCVGPERLITHKMLYITLNSLTVCKQLSRLQPTNQVQRLRRIQLGPQAHACPCVCSRRSRGWCRSPRPVLRLRRSQRL